MPNYTSGVTLITCTGDRPAAFKLCQRYIARQTYSGPLQWVIVDDGSEARLEGASWERDGETLFSQILPEPKWKQGQNTLARNLLAAIPEVVYDKVFVCEDDDWYSPHYVECMAKRLGHADIVGESHARYYHVPTKRYWTLDNDRHASLAQTGLRSDLLPFLERVCKDPSSSFIDVRLWAELKCASRVLGDTKYSVGIKGLPGRPGIGVGHRPERMPGNWLNDPNLVRLREWVGDDVDLYREFTK